MLGNREDRIMMRTDRDATKADFDCIFDPKEGWLKKRLRDPEAAAKAERFGLTCRGSGIPI